MLGRCSVAAMVVALALDGPSFARADTLDRIAVTVGKDVITESQVILDLDVAAFLDHRAVDLSPSAKRQAAERLVDQLLILREAADSHVTLPSTEAAKGLVAPYAAESGYQAELKQYGISEADLAAHLLAGLRTLTFTNLRFRPDALVPEEEIRNYYDKTVRESKAPAAPVPSFEASRDSIEKLLVEQHVLDALDQWLVMTRSAAHIGYREKAFQ
ncbi:MAG TPA: hypothetical protein VGJ09_04280 [Bryobacteraceae bacterium]|jgi:hypothetical protein